MARCEAHHSGYRTETSILADKSKAFWGIPWLFSSWDSALSRKGHSGVSEVLNCIVVLYIHYQIIHVLCDLAEPR